MPGSKRSVAVLTMVAGLIAAAALLWPIVTYAVPEATDSSGPDPVQITNYDVDYTLDADGTLHAVETITADFPCCRHGIFRLFDVVDPSDSSARLVPHDITVSQDSQPAQVDYSWERGRRYRVAKIGDADKYVSPGSHVYRISYVVDGALSPTSAGRGATQSGSWAGGGDGSVFYWDVVPNGWQMAIAQARIRIHLPAPSAQAQCASGSDCTVAGAGTSELTLRAGPLAPHTAVTIRADVATPAADRVTVPWSIAGDGILGRSPGLAVFVALLSVVALVGGRLWERRTRETPPGYPVTYEPPAGLGPVQAAYIVEERVPDNALTASLLYAAERGLVKLEELGKRDWMVTGIGSAPDWDQVDPVTRNLGSALLVGTRDSHFHADGGQGAGLLLSSVQSELGKWTKDWALESGLLSKHPAEDAARFALVIAAIGAAVVTVFRPFGMTLFAFPLAAFVIGAVGLVRAGVGTRRTPAGRETWSRSGGFRRLLATDSAVERFDFSAHRDLYTAFIPFAVAFDCAKQWARKYEQTVGEPAPTPVWYGGTAGGFSSGNFSGFESSLNSSIGAYESSQRSSSSSGGSFGGGGGGGGGGGSW